MLSPRSLSRLVPALLGLVLVVGVGCETKEAPETYVARVGDHHLRAEEVDEMLAGMGPVPDSGLAREQVVEQWVEKTLLLREAERLNLAQDPEVKQLLEKRRRNTLVTALTNRIYENIEQSPSEEEVRTYFERHQAQLTLREPYVRVRHLAAMNREMAAEARRALLGVRGTVPDTTWARLSRQYAERPEQSIRMAGRFFPESRLFARLPYVKDELSALREGEIAPLVRDNDRVHVLQLVRRVPAGSEPELRWVEDEIRRRLQIRLRKQMYAREVQRLRNRAKADDQLEMP
jgi:parvulin-like peptidyl-prolyl isomerase